jgi:4-aminobutyrate aminotransferase-like enzyme
MTYVVLVNLLGEVEFGHPVLVDVDRLGLSLGVELVPTESEHVPISSRDVGVRRQLHAGVALLVLGLLQASWIVAERRRTTRAGGLTGR